MAHGVIPNQTKENGRWLSLPNSLRASFFFAYASLAAWMPMLTIWLEDHAMPKSYIGYVAAIPWLVMLLVQPIWGVVADRAGKKHCLLITTLIAVAVFACFPLVAKDAILVMIMTTLMALFNTPILPLLDSITLDWVASNKKGSYASFRFWGAPGFAAGAFIASYCISLWHIDVIFYLSACFLLLAWGLIAGLQSKHQLSTEEYSFKGIENLLKDKLLIIFMLVILVVSIAQSSSSFFLTVYLREIDATAGITGTALAVQALSELPFYFLAAWLLKKTTAGRIVLIAIFGTALRLLLYSLNTTPAWVIAIELMNGITWTLLWIAAVDYVDQRVPAAWRTTGQSLLWAAYFGAGAIAGNIFSGYLHQSMPMKSVYGINSLLAALAGLLAMAAFLLVQRPAILRKSTYNTPNT